LELAKTVLNRETLKQECVRHTQNVWEKRFNFVELKRKFPMLGDKADEEMLHDKERVPKIAKMESCVVFLVSIKFLNSEYA
jgi:enhancer of polycomb-like protein